MWSDPCVETLACVGDIRLKFEIGATFDCLCFILLQSDKRSCYPEPQELLLVQTP